VLPELLGWGVRYDLYYNIIILGAGQGWMQVFLLGYDIAIPTML
jgi:hypothetical protein